MNIEQVKPDLMIEVLESAVARNTKQISKNLDMIATLAKTVKQLQGQVNELSGTVNG